MISRVFRTQWRLPGLSVGVFVAAAHTPEVVQFLWQPDGSEVAAERIYRHVAGPAQVMVYVDDEDTVGWMWDPTFEPDSTMLAVLKFVDELPLTVLLEFVRETAAGETRESVDAVAHGERELESARRMLAYDQMMEVALSFDRVEQLGLALGMLLTWAGTGDELRAAVLDVFPDELNPA